MSPLSAMANARQRQGSDPAVSAFVAASAGSGKTKLLVDRLLRLMLADPGVDPSRILCLTFTKAGAAEMALRLRRELASWMRFDDADLTARLATLDIRATPEALRAARQLFARVLDLPGGMRIGTIHAFCQSLLRRFPLEARVSPHFDVLADTEARIARQEAREVALESGEGAAHEAAVALLAGTVDLDAFGALIGRLAGRADRPDAAFRLEPAQLAEAQRRVLRVTQATRAEIIAEAVNWQGERTLREAIAALGTIGSATEQRHATQATAWLRLPPEARQARWAEWHDLHQRGSGGPKLLGGIVKSNAAKADDWICATLQGEINRVESVADACRAFDMAKVSYALASLARPALTAFAEAKQRGDTLDYDDLIARTLDLLDEPGAAWVLYKLDGGINHLLLDEVQDTSAAQWRIADALTGEFYTGAGARSAARTVFAVGDRKQSIFSFQGAAPDEFARWNATWRARAKAAGQPWRDVPLDISFRSTRPVLALVDAVFADPSARRGVIEDGADLHHDAYRASAPGSAEIWPLIEAAPQPTAAAWNAPRENLPTQSPQQELAGQLAGWIADEIERGAVAPGDVLVLVRNRQPFAPMLLGELKKRDIPVAGADRLELAKHTAVTDLLAMCNVLLLPEDDLTLATFLVSPLGGLSHESMHDLAIGRPGSLWQALRERAPERAEWGLSLEFLDALAARVDFVTPHAMLAEALGPGGGRARLLARLGPEAAEPIDELLRAALDYAALHPSSLQGFVHWLQAAGVEIKRDQDAAGDAVRVMTVHAAKGLEAKLVILPDTTRQPPRVANILWARDHVTNAEIPIWAPSKEMMCRAADPAREAAEAAEREESNRLLYVALTRARDRLVVCGWTPGNGVPDDCWYRLVARGFSRLSTLGHPFRQNEDGDMVRLEQLVGSDDAPPPEAPRQAPSPPRQPASVPVPPPGWAGAAPDWRAKPPPAEPTPAVPLAPSRPDEADIGRAPQAPSPLDGSTAGERRFLRGQLVHTLLQHLPSLPRERREAAAEAFLTRPAHGLAPEVVARLTAEVLGVLDDPSLAPAFAPSGRSEAPLTGLVRGAVVGGLIDRLAVGNDGVLAVDFKTGRPESDPASTPIRYLRQMAAYRAVLRDVFPGVDVRCVLVWTQGPLVVPLPDPLLDAYEPSAARASA
jgi:ATP-dependent helicase/nuclease subunit A